MESHILSIILFTPLVGAILLLFVPKENKDAIRWIANIFALGGFLNALFAKNFEQVNWIPTFVLTPLTYFGGVFYSISLLPDWARRLSYVNPILHMVSAFRYGFLGTSDVNLAVAFALMLLAAAALFALAVALLDRGTGIRD